MSYRAYTELSEFGSLIGWVLQWFCVFVLCLGAYHHFMDGDKAAPVKPATLKCVMGELYQYDEKNNLYVKQSGTCLNS